MAATTSNIKQTSSVQDFTSSKPPFGSRFLTEDQDVWSQNAWDHVPPPSDQSATIAASLVKQKSAPVPDEEKTKYNDRPYIHWNNFYKSNTSNFFRDRKWLKTEFPDLEQVLGPQAEGDQKIVAELGCGVGNALFPLYEANRNPNLSFRAYDYSGNAIKFLKQNPLYEPAEASGKIVADVWDLSSRDGLPAGLEENSVDVVLLIFALSALHPDEWDVAIRNVHRILKPGGCVLLRDYGRYDLTQLRFKTGRLLEDNFYIRGDKTRVYFFDLNELAILFTGAKLSQPPTVREEVEATEEENPVLSQSSTPMPDLDVDSSPATPSQEGIQEPTYDIHPLLEQRLQFPSKDGPLFTMQQLGIDRRLIINRSRKLKMYRVWMQGVFRKAELV